MFLGHVLYWVQSGKETFWSQTLRSWKRWTHQKIHAWRLNAKEVLTLQHGEHVIFPIADGTVKLSGGDQVLRTSTLIRDSLERGEERKDLRGESDGSPPRGTSPRDGEARNEFWSLSGNYIYRHPVEPRANFTCREKSPFPIPLRFVDVARTASATLDVVLERRIDDYWNVEGDRDLSDARTGFTRITMLDEKPPDGYTWSGERQTKEANNIHARSRVTRNMEKHVRRSPTQRKTKVGYRKTKAR